MNNTNPISFNFNDGNLQEAAGLSRIVKHMSEHDCGTITAWRSARDCNQGQPYTRGEKDARNRSLLAKLKDARYGIVSGQGGFVETSTGPDGKTIEKEVLEDVFFVIDIQDKGQLLNDLKRWGEHFEQDSILYIPKGEKGQLHRTNDCDANDPKGNVVAFDARTFGHRKGFYTLINNRPYTFTFKTDLDGNLTEETLPEGFMERWKCNGQAQSRWEEA